MRTNIVIDQKLLKEAQKLTGIKTKKGVVDEALKELIATKRKKPLTALFGKIKFATGYNYKALRQ